MELLLFGIWETSVSYYWLLYGIFGLLGFFLCYFNRYLIALVIPIIAWFAVSDYQYFYHKVNVRPDDSYIFSAVLAMVLAVVATVFGFVMNMRNLKPLK